MVRTKVCHEAKCDICGEMAAQHYETQKDFIQNLRSEGWIISKNKTVCPKHRTACVPNDKPLIITAFYFRRKVNS